MAQIPSHRPPEPAVTSGMKIGIAIGTVFVPLLGIIMGLIYMNDENPEKKAAGKLWLGIGGGMMALNVICVCVCCVFGGLAEGM